MRKNKTILGEIENKAKQHERHYRKNDGTAMCVISNANINYFDENEQKWKHTDNSITENEDYYEANLGNFKAQLTKETGKSAINIFGKDMSVSWEYLGIDKPKERKAASTIKVKKNDEKNLIVGSEAHYKNVDDGIDIQYVMVGNNVKENIIVRKKQDNYSFKFAYKLNGLELRKSEDEEKLELYSPKTNKVEFTIPAPYMYDANGVKSQDVHYEIEATTEDTYTLTVVTSTEWINTKERKFPVTIDPLLIQSDENIMSYETANYFVVSSTLEKELMGTNTGSLVLENSSTKSSVAYIRLKPDFAQIDKDDLIGAYLTLTLRESINPEKEYITVKYGTNIDKSAFNYYQTVCYDNEIKIPLTADIIKAKEQIVISLELVGIQTDTYNIYTDSTNMPKLEIVYIDKDVRQSNIKMFPLVGGAEAHINMLTGDKTVAVPDMIDENMGVSISHVFKYSDDDFCCGNDVRLNVHETLVKNTDGEIEASYIYTDNLGNKHYLKERFYHLVDGEKVYVEDKESVTVLPNGQLIIDASDGDVDIEVYREEASYNGQKATTKLEGVYNVEYFEQRIDEQKQLEEQYKSYEQVLKDFVISDLGGNIVMEFGKEKDSGGKYTIEDVLNESKNSSSENIALSKNEAMTLKSLWLQRDSLIHTINALTLQSDIITNQNTCNKNLRDEYDKQATDINNQISSLSDQINQILGMSDLNKEYVWLLYHTRNENDEQSKPYNRQQIANYVKVSNTGELISSIEYNQTDCIDCMNSFMLETEGYLVSKSEFLQIKNCIQQQAEWSKSNN